MLSRMPRYMFCVGWLIGLVLAGCQSDPTPITSVEPLSAPVSTPSGQPHLHADADGTVWLSWIEPVDSVTHALRYATFDGRSWSALQTAATGTDWFVNWADVPSLRPLPDGRRVAHFLKSNGPDVFAYDVRITQTAQDGAWQPALTPHRDKTQTEHGFASLLPWDGDVLAVWLDGRRMDTHASDTGGHGVGPMTLRSALIAPDGQVSHPFEIDDRVCECCPTAAVRTADGVLVAYRDRSENEVRNIGLTRFDGDEWSDPYLLHDDGWQINGCPVNGPALAADGNRVAAAWFTAPNSRPRVQVAFSDDGGRQFGEPLVVDADGPTGRVDVVLLDDGSALVSWIGTHGEDTALLVRQIHPSGTASSRASLASVSRSRGTGMPRMVRRADRVYWAWVGTAGDAPRVQMAHALVPTP